MLWSGKCKITQIYEYNLCKLKTRILKTTEHYIFSKEACISVIYVIHPTLGAYGRAGKRSGDPDERRDITERKSLLAWTMVYY